MSPSRTPVALAVAALALAPTRAHALQDVFIPYVGVGLEYDNNVFDLPGKSEARGLNGTGQLGDAVTRAIAGLAINYEFGRQNRFRATVEGRQARYLHFDALNHSEYMLGAGLDWHASDVLDGSVDARAERRMVPFTERNTTALTLERERYASARAALLLSPEWRTEARASARVLDTPLPEAPDFELRENSARASLTYLGVETLEAGVSLEAVDGSYRNIAQERDFEQHTLALVLGYRISGLSRVHAEIGDTRRLDKLEGVKGVSALTGELGYEREISGKTKVSGKVFRRVRSDLRGAGFVDETGVALEGIWKVTAKTTGSLAYERVRSDYQYLSLTSNGARSDTRQSVELQFTWQALPWLAVRAHAGYRGRDADSRALQFDGETIGVDFLVKPET